jgi:hypothetical protein
MIVYCLIKILIISYDATPPKKALIEWIFVSENLTISNAYF